MIYLDHNASAPVCEAAKRAMLEALSVVGNPSSTHAHGRAARAIVEGAREAVAAAIGARPEEVFFTSGGTEACALGVRGALLATGRILKKTSLATTPIEHSAVRNAYGEADARLAKVDPQGRLDVADLGAKLDKGVDLVAISSASNELGTRQPVAEVAERAKRRKTPLFCDAVQSLGKEPIDVDAWGVDLLALSAHKIGGPLGVGALYVRRGTALEPLFGKGAQEKGLRAGTENVACIAGFGAAVAEVERRLLAMEAVRRRRDALLARLRAALPEVVVHGDPAGGLANTLSLRFPSVTDGDALRLALDLNGVSVSHGSACASGAVEPSHVLLAIGLPTEVARSAIRISLGPETSEADVEHAAAVIVAVVGSVAGG